MSNFAIFYVIIVSNAYCPFSLVLGSTYNIPVCMWLLDSHPYNPPMAYVKPTSTMQIKPGQHVDSNGKVYLPYLHDWRHVSWLDFWYIIPFIYYHYIITSNCFAGYLTCLKLSCLLDSLDKYWQNHYVPTAKQRQFCKKP